MNNEKNITQGSSGQSGTRRITISGQGADILIDCRENESLLEAMTRQQIYVDGACGGRGTCGKCKVLLLEGDIAVTSFDRKVLTQQELAKGWRLSCKAYPSSDCRVRQSPGTDGDYKAVTDFQRTEETKQGQGEYAIAIDIGTTTIAVGLLDTGSAELTAVDTELNQQRAYGADVISRIQASNQGKAEVLRKSIQRDLLEGIRLVSRKSGIDKGRICRAAIACNTTMGHLLLGYSCEALGTYPFTPVNIAQIILPFREVFDSEELDIPVTILPGISAFVGGDVVSGLYACDMDQAKAPVLMIDLGTNGEMAIGNQDRILVSSAAAGPAFEGGNISCGIGSVAGAISRVSLHQEGLEYQTIGGCEPVGICGTGVIELICELRKGKLIDETGLLEDQYFEEGFPVADASQGRKLFFTQKDIREIQLAKAAIRAGLDLLISRYGASYEAIDKVYLAGGFGDQMNTEKAVAIGLLPRELSDKLEAVGNSALGGTVKYLTHREASERMKHILALSKEISLANDPEFYERYILAMNFE